MSAQEGLDLVVDARVDASGYPAEIAVDALEPGGEFRTRVGPFGAEEVFRLDESRARRRCRRRRRRGRGESLGPVDHLLHRRRRRDLLGQLFQVVLRQRSRPRPRRGDRDRQSASLGREGHGLQPRFRIGLVDDGRREVRRVFFPHRCTAGVAALAERGGLQTCGVWRQDRDSSRDGNAVIGGLFVSRPQLHVCEEQRCRLLAVLGSVLSEVVRRRS